MWTIKVIATTTNVDRESYMENALNIFVILSVLKQTNGPMKLNKRTVLTAMVIEQKMKNSLNFQKNAHCIKMARLAMF